jgi:hypothetical protein
VGKWTEEDMESLEDEAERLKRKAEENDDPRARADKNIITIDFNTRTSGFYSVRLNQKCENPLVSSVLSMVTMSDVRTYWSGQLLQDLKCGSIERWPHPYDGGDLVCMAIDLTCYLLRHMDHKTPRWKCWCVVSRIEEIIAVCPLTVI